MSNARVGRQIALVTLVWTAGLLSPQQLAFAQGKCQEVSGRFIDVYQGGSSSSGRITNAGVLNGTTLTVFNTAAFPTPEPTIVLRSGPDDHDE
jgi:hypothetical protein